MFVRHFYIYKNIIKLRVFREHIVDMKRKAFNVKFTVKNKLFFCESVASAKTVGILSNPFHDFLPVAPVTLVLENDVERLVSFFKDKLNVGWNRRGVFSQFNLVPRYVFRYLFHCTLSFYLITVSVGSGPPIIWLCSSNTS